MRKKNKTILAVIITFLSLTLIWTVWSNKALELNSYIIESGDIPAVFDGFRIAHVSDLHNFEMGEKNEKLLTMLHKAKPDMIAITGDLIDSHNTDIEIALQFAEEAVKIAPCYYVSGNHEAGVREEYNKLKEGLASLGVAVLEDERAEIDLSGGSIVVLGVRDPDFLDEKADYVADSVMARKFEELSKEDDQYRILLSHRPEMFDIYAESGVNLVFSGHAHGGQFRLPFIGGVVAPGQGLFPEYDSGIFTKDNTNMLVSRGVGNSIIPVRFNNRPEVIVAELKSLYTEKKMEEIEMTSLEKALYDKIKSEVLKWDEEDIYAISFFVESNEENKYNNYENVSVWDISYNTEKDCGGAGELDEERWNYAFWRQDVIPVINVDTPNKYTNMLFDWYAENGITNIGEENEDEMYDEDCNYIGKGPVGHYELLQIASNVARKLQEEGVIKEHFGKELPIIVHGLEYAWYDIEATEKANPNGEADTFLKAMKELDFC